MARTPLRVFPSPDGIGEELALGILERIEHARMAGSRFLLGCPTGRTPRPIYRAMSRRLGRTKQNISHLALVMMDEYLVQGNHGLEFAPDDKLWSCHHFVREEIAGPLNEGLPPANRIHNESIWFPDPRDPEEFDNKIANAGGIDFFILASGASDGHVAFNPPGSARHSRTRVIQLSEETRRDNLQTFPAFGHLGEVPNYGISVGIDTIASAREAVMIVWGGGKRLTLSRMLSADGYEPDWPATVIHECAVREIWSDTEAGKSIGRPLTTIEAAVESLESALAAEGDGAGRIELCANLSVGGTTPSAGLIAGVLEKAQLPVFVMIRPRGGGFVYSDAEIAAMTRDIERARKTDIGGIVTGVLEPDGGVDVDRTRSLVESAAGLPVTFHRAFDRTGNLPDALEQLIEIGISRVLTSGAAPTALDGASVIAALVAQARDRITIVAGGGVRDHNVRELVVRTGVGEVHARDVRGIRRALTG